MYMYVHAYTCTQHAHKRNIHVHVHVQYMYIRKKGPVEGGNNVAENSQSDKMLTCNDERQKNNCTTMNVHAHAVLPGVREGPTCRGGRRDGESGIANIEEDGGGRDRRRKGPSE